MKNQLSLRAILVCLISLAAAWLMIELVWGASGGLIGGLTLSQNPEYQKKLTEFLKAKGIDTNDASQMRAAIKRLSREDRKEMLRITKDALAGTNWFVVCIIVSGIVFGVIGFLGGLTSRGWVLIGLLPLFSLLTNNPIVRFGLARSLPAFQKVVIVLIQLFVCVGLAFLGSILARKRMKKKWGVS